jgi:hypothetical protein
MVKQRLLGEGAHDPSGDAEDDERIEQRIRMVGDDQHRAIRNLRAPFVELMEFLGGPAGSGCDPA